MYLIAVFFPVLSLIVVSLLSWGYLTPWCSNVGIFSSLIISLLLSVYALYEVVYLNATCAVECAPWFEFGTLQITWSFLFDKFNTITFFLVISISLCVHVFALTYLNDDPHLSRFLLLLYFFTVFMQILVTAGNFMQLFVGWEGVGLISYLLINFWFTRYEAVNSGLMAIIYNRVGDCGFILALCLVLYFLKTNDFLVFSSCNLYTNMIILQIFDVNIKLIDFIIIGFTIGTIGKSAQIFLECWLSLAMEGPTPVSSLLHAATLVISGLIILCRIFLVIQNSFIGMNFLVLLGALTSFFAATTGLFMVDIKRVIAYSTCSQLGYLVFCIGLSQFDVAVFHLINHAFFKCLLFIGAGFIIHALSNEQDLRKLGSLFKLLPYIFVLMCFSSIALMGLPFFSGFFSKEKILESSFYIFNELNLISFWLGCLSALFTAIYSTKLLYLSFFATPNNTKFNYSVYFHADNLMFLNSILMFLGLASIFSGFYLSDLIIGNGTDFFIFNNNNIVHNIIDFHIGNLHINLLGLYYSIFGICLILVILNKNNHYVILKLLQPVKYINGQFKFFHLNLKMVFTFLSYRWYINFIYNELIALPTLKLGFNYMFLMLDQGYILYMLGQMYVSKLSTKYTSWGVNITQIKIINELFLLLFLSFFIFNWIISTELIITILSLDLTNTNNFIYIIYFFFAVPKKRSKKNKILKKVIFNKCANIRRTNVKSVHFDEFFNNLQKWDIN